MFSKIFLCRNFSGNNTLCSSSNWIKNCAATRPSPSSPTQDQWNLSMAWHLVFVYSHSMQSLMQLHANIAIRLKPMLGTFSHSFSGELYHVTQRMWFILGLQMKRKRLIGRLLQYETVLIFLPNHSSSLLATEQFTFKVYSAGLSITSYIYLRFICK